VISTYADAGIEDRLYDPGRMLFCKKSSDLLRCGLESEK
jgi:hypothetical protein